MKEIIIDSSIHGRHVILLDDEDFDKISKYKWRVNKNGRYLRPVTTSKGLKVHHFVIPKKEGFVIDHIDKNTFNNQKNNLRYATKSQNGANSLVKANNKATGFKGVNVNSNKNRAKRFGAHIKVNYKKIFLGWYETAHEAAKVYNEAAIKYFGEFASLNNVSNA